MDQVRRTPRFFVCYLAITALLSLLGMSEAFAATASSPAGMSGAFVASTSSLVSLSEAYAATASSPAGISGAFVTSTSSLVGLSEAYAATASSPARQGESIEELYEKAKKEGGQLTLYIALSARSEEIILPLFKKRFPAIQVNHIDATSDKLVARVLAEQRGGRIIGDVFGGTPGYLAQMTEQKLLTPLALPEAAAYPATLKGAEWVATDTQYFIAGWNTSLVKGGDEPKQFEDFADPKWKGKLIAEPRDFQLLMGLAKRKYKSDEKAVDVLKKIAGNGVEFHKGHSQLVELLVAGQAPVCLTCYSHHFPPRIKKGAPILPLLSEGVGEVGGTVAILKGAPHPHAAMLWARWAVSDEGQKAYAQAGETPAHPNVEPAEKVRPATTYMLTAEEVKEFPKYEKLWKEIFQIR